MNRHNIGEKYFSKFNRGRKKVFEVLRAGPNGGRGTPYLFTPCVLFASQIIAGNLWRSVNGAEGVRTK